MKRNLASQMADQMDISKKEAGGLMAKAKKANDLEGFQTGGVAQRPPGTGGYEPKRNRYFGAGYLKRNDGGIAKKTKVY